MQEARNKEEEQRQRKQVLESREKKSREEARERTKRMEEDQCKQMQETKDTEWGDNRQSRGKSEYAQWPHAQDEEEQVQDNNDEITRSRNPRSEEMRKAANRLWKQRWKDKWKEYAAKRSTRDIIEGDQNGPGAWRGAPTRQGLD